MVHRIIDTNTFRKHLFGSWHLLTFLAGRAREATLQIYIPWVTYREVMTGIEDAVDRQIQRQEVARGIRQIESAGGDPARAKELSEALEHYRQQTIAETRRGFHQ